MRYFFRITVMSTFLVAIIACSSAAKKSEVSTQKSLPDINVFVGTLLPGWHLAVENPDGQKILTGERVQAPRIAESSAPKSDVSLSLSQKTSKNDALTLSWKDSWRAGAVIEGGEPLNLQHYLPAGVITFDLNVIELAKGGLAFKFKCGKNCERQVPFLFPARAMIGKGWQHVVLPLSCFAQDGDDFSAVTLPLALETGGEGQVSLANVKVQANGQPNVTCPDYKTASVTPDMLNEWWSIDWWLPRHEKKLQDIKAHNIDLVFIGDSITEGWEKSGVPVWNKYYANRNAIALGFGGDRTENILWRLLHGEVDGIHPKVAVLMFGTNNAGLRHEAPVFTAKGIKRDIEELQKRLPNTKILLLAIFPRDEKPEGELRQINNGVNSIISGFADNKKIFFLDINNAFLDANGVLSKEIMPDLLHPNEKGYEIWASNMEPTLKKLLGEK